MEPKNIIRSGQGTAASLEIGIASIIGTREYQQDFVCCQESPDGCLAAVCDGMGGLEGGELASSTAAASFLEGFAGRDRQKPVCDFFQEQALAANALVCGLTNKRGEALKAGTTIVAAVVTGQELYWLSVGDSRIYLIRGGVMSQVTRDHNYRLVLEKSRRSGAISEERFREEERTRQAEALISYLGVGRLSLMDINRTAFALREGDIILLCSDGLYKSLTDSQIKAMVRDNDIDMQIAADRLCSMALRCGRGVQDNTSVLLLQYRPAVR